ncbi:MAG: hypothetical protein LBG81_00980, partial [Coriobacteriaceae bacterium]|nr:hypothetical protein [Coriobacteriaceae bacterium]
QATRNATTGVVSVTGLKAGSTTIAVEAAVGGYTYRGTVTVDVAGVYDISQLGITLAQQRFVYPGTSVEPAVTITKRSTALEEGVDYALFYGGNNRVGNAIVMIVGLGEYAASIPVSRSFEIIEAPLFLVGYRAWDSSFDANNGFAEIGSTLDPSSLVGLNGSGSGVSTQNLALTFNRPVAITDASALLAQINISWKTASKDTTVALDPQDPSTIVFKMRDKAATTTAQAGSGLTASPVDASRTLDALVAADDPTAVAYLPYNIQSTQPTGLAIEQVSSTTGTESVPASVTYRISSLPLVRSMNFLRFEADGMAPGQASGYFTIHSHTFYTMDAITHVGSLEANAGPALAGAGYDLVNNGDGSFTVVAQQARPGEVLSWQVWAYPNRNANDKKIDLWEALQSTQAPQDVKNLAYAVLLDGTASAAEVALAIESLADKTVREIGLELYAHSAMKGWMGAVSLGGIAGTQGMGLSLQALVPALKNATGYAGGISYEAHVASIGWQGARQIASAGKDASATAGEQIGTTGLALPIEALRFDLTGDLADHYDIYYRVHSASAGWLGWAKNGAPAGTVGLALQAEAVEVRIVAEGTTPYGNSIQPAVLLDGSAAGRQSALAYNVVAHLENKGDTAYDDRSPLIGTSGQALRLEALRISLDAPSGITGGIEYRTHVQNIGWTGWVSEGGLSGTSGQALRLEAVDIRLTGELAGRYDVYYRSHIQNIGWTGWARNGDSTGSAGYAYRMEALQVVIVEKGTYAPGMTGAAFSQR